MLGRDDEGRLVAAAGAYPRMGATWWVGRLPAGPAPRSDRVHLHPGAPGL